jgi:hypothetical protein
MKLNVVTGLISIVMTKTGPDSAKRRELKRRKVIHYHSTISICSTAIQRLTQNWVWRKTG